MSKYDKLIKTLQDIFMLDHAELDFGIYRIMNQKRSDIQRFLEKELIPQVKTELAKNINTDSDKIKADLEKTIKTLKENDVDPETSSKVIKLRAELELSATNLDNEENDVFSALTKFFSRYYEGGDFVSKRRYKSESTYAIPYNGEEVKLHWANADQYYIKTSEYFKKYQFKINDTQTLVFELLEAETEQNNNKTAADKVRRFAFDVNTPLRVEDNTLYISYLYEPMDKKTTQTDLNKIAFDAIKTQLPQHFFDALKQTPTEKQKDRTLLEKHISDYTARNSFDYFIHKDLGKFLNNELDFFIKNEIFHLDDLAVNDDNTFIRQLAKVRAIKIIATKIIAFLAQLEDFQRKLWLKKKFVTDTQYCFTLDRVPTAFYAEIAQNQAQIKAWIDLFSIDEIKTQEPADLLSEKTTGFSNPLSLEFLNENIFLVLDTQYFSSDFKNRLIAEIPNLDDTLDGLLLHSENFQALQLLQERYREQVKCVYIDPPYNTSASEILYKNSYKHSSWLSFINDRILLSKMLMSNDANICVTIDDFEYSNLQILLDEIFTKENYLATASIRNNPSGRSTVKGFSINHEYGLFYSKSDESSLGRLPHNEKQKERYDLSDDIGNYEWENLRRNGPDSNKNDRPKQYYPIYFNTLTNTVRIPKMNYNEKIKEWDILENCNENELILFPIHPNKEQKVWRYSFDNIVNEPTRFKVVKGDDYEVYRKKYLNVDGISPRTWWDNPLYSARDNGSRTIVDIFGALKTFDFPKSMYAVLDSIKILNSNRKDTILDYFAGSGTTGHAVINLNREDGGKRKYILCEMGEYFDVVTKPRIMKVIYSPDWKGGKPTAHGKGSSHAFKYLRLESYEDTLNNLTLAPSATQTLALQEDARFREGYMLGYMLDVESRESLLNVAWFRKPFDCYLHITRQNESRETRIDLVETFNYLIGLVIEQQYYPRAGFCIVRGRNLSGERLLVIWRDLETTTNEDLENMVQRSDINPRDQEFTKIYINGDHHLDNLRSDEEQWKVLLIEAEFKRKMFEF